MPTAARPVTTAELRAAGWRPGLIGTVAVGIGDERAANANRNTTPEALELQALLAEYGPAGRTTPGYPFHYLVTDGVWEVRTERGFGSPGRMPAEAGR